MQPNSMVLMLILAVVAALVPIAVAAFWVVGPAPSRRRWLGFPMILLIVLGQVAAVGAVGVRMNREYGFYDTWDSVLGAGGETAAAAPKPEVQGFGSDPGPGSTDAPTSGTTDPGATTPGTTASSSSSAEPNGGKQVLLTGTPSPGSRGRSMVQTYRGPRSGLTGTMHVWLPPQYDDPRYKDYVFPVILAYPGIGAQDSYYWSSEGLDAENALPKAVASGKVAPFVVVMPSMRFMPNHPDPECIDAPGGANAETWAHQDVPAWIRSNLRVSERARDWSAYGFSLGGYCALKLHLQHPEILGSAIMFSGNFHASAENSEPAVARAIAQDRAAAEEVLPLLTKADRTKVRMLIGETGDPAGEDQVAVADFKKAADKAGYSAGVQTWDLGLIGHHPRLWGKNAGKFLEWVTALMRS